MTAPRLEVDLSKIYDNASSLVGLLGKHGVSVTGVTKASLGSVKIANALLCAGVSGLGDSRIENIKAMRLAEVSAPMTLIRSPMMSQVESVVRYADVSFNTEISVIKKLSLAASSADCKHSIVLMVELGDLREGIMPSDVEDILRQTLQLSNIEIAGIGTNLACRSGVIPDADNMTELSELAEKLESTFGLTLPIVSGGSSANLEWLINGGNLGRINDLRLGESILLGREPLKRSQIPGLHTDAITLVAEVIESKFKPSLPKGKIGQTAFGENLAPSNLGTVAQSLLAIGRQDIDYLGLLAPAEIEILDSCSDHLIVSSAECLKIGSELTFQLNYSALLRAMTSAFVNKIFINENSIN